MPPRTKKRQKVKDGSVEEAAAAARDLFATLDRVRPEGIRYASTRAGWRCETTAYRGNARGLRDRQAFEGVRLRAVAGH